PLIDNDPLEGIGADGNRVRGAIESEAAAKELVAGVSEREASHIAIFDLGSTGQTEAAIAAVHKHLAAWPRDALVISIAANPNGLIGGSGRLGQSITVTITGSCPTMRWRCPKTGSSLRPGRRSSGRWR